MMHGLNSDKIFELPFRGVAQPGSAPAWGAGGRRFESCHPDQLKQRLRSQGRGPIHGLFILCPLLCPLTRIASQSSSSNFSMH